MTTDREIARWRLRSQHLVRPHAASAQDVVRGLLAVQAENPSQAAWAVASRTQHPDAADLDTLLDEGHVVRTHVLRPTWHFVTAEDIGWLLELTAPRVRPLVARQLENVHGWTDSDVDHAGALLVRALRDEPDQTRERLAECLRGHGLQVSGPVMMLLLAVLELDRLVCSGRRLAAAHTYAAFCDRVPVSRRRTLDRDEALAELALRYVTGHGPATERDLAYWATLTLGDVRRGLGLVDDRLACFEHDGRTFWHAPDQEPPAGPAEPTAHLLQILDEIYRGYQDSRMVLDVADLVPRGRETAIGMVLLDGQLVARMKRTTGHRAVFEVSPYDGPLAAAQLAAVGQAARRYADFLGLEPELRVT